MLKKKKNCFPIQSNSFAAKSTANPKQLEHEIDLLIDVTDDFLGAQLFGFFYAGYETSALGISNTLYELALNQRVQDKLRDEIQKFFADRNGELQYEDVNAIPYLNAVFKGKRIEMLKLR